MPDTARPGRRHQSSAAQPTPGTWDGAASPRLRGLPTVVADEGEIFEADKDASIASAARQPPKSACCAVWASARGGIAPAARGTSWPASGAARTPVRAGAAPAACRTSRSARRAPEPAPELASHHQPAVRHGLHAVLPGPAPVRALHRYLGDARVCAQRRPCPRMCRRPQAARSASGPTRGAARATTRAAPPALCASISSRGR